MKSNEFDTDKGREKSSPVFVWRREEMDVLLATCETDDVFPLIQRHIEKDGLALDVGCGSGRYVRFMSDNGWNIAGIELSKETVEMVNEAWPDLKIVQGDAESIPFEQNEFDSVISFGVVEHSQQGPQKALKEIFRVLKPGGRAVITVPCHNRIRRWKRLLYWYELQTAHIIFARMLKGQKPFCNRLNPAFSFATHPAVGDFFEYRLTPEEFAAEVRQAGFDIIEHVPIALMDGIFHELNPFGLLVKFKEWKFMPTALGLWLNRFLAKRDFFHCHMQAVAVCKPSESG